MVTFTIKVHAGAFHPVRNDFWFPASPFPLVVPATMLLLLFHSVHSLQTHQSPLVRPESFSVVLFCCSALQPNFVFHHTLQYFLFFTQYFHFLHRISTPPFQLNQTINCAFHLGKRAMQTSSSPCSKNFKIFWPFSFLACKAGNLLD